MTFHCSKNATMGQEPGQVGRSHLLRDLIKQSLNDYSEKIFDQKLLICLGQIIFWIWIFYLYYSFFYRLLVLWTVNSHFSYKFISLTPLYIHVNIWERVLDPVIWGYSISALAEKQIRWRISWLDYLLDPSL